MYVFLWFHFFFFFWIYIFPMFLTAECPVGTGIFFSLFLDVYFSNGSYSGVPCWYHIAECPVGTGFFFSFF